MASGVDSQEVFEARPLQIGLSKATITFLWQARALQIGLSKATIDLLVAGVKDATASWSIRPLS